MHEIGRPNLAYHFLPNSARNGISVCSRNDLKISDFYLNALLPVGTVDLVPVLYYQYQLYKYIVHVMHVYLHVDLYLHM